MGGRGKNALAEYERIVATIPQSKRTRPYIDLQGKAWQKLTVYILRRDEHTCRKCHQRHEHLCVHHLDGDKTNNHVVNLVTLCLRCHSKLLVIDWELVTWMQQMVAENLRGKPASTKPRRERYKASERCHLCLDWLPKGTMQAHLIEVHHADASTFRPVRKKGQQGTGHWVCPACGQVLRGIGLLQCHIRGAHLHRISRQ